MDALKAIHTRRSVRQFTSELVSERDIEEILNAGRLAPSGSNIQAWTFIVVDDLKVIDLVKMFSPGLFTATPLIIAVCSDLRKYEESGGLVGKEYLRIADCAMAVENMLLTAHAINLGACPIRSFSPIALKVILELPGGVEPELLVIVGNPVNQPKTPPKVQLKHIAYRNTYGTVWK